MQFKVGRRCITKIMPFCMQQKYHAENEVKFGIRENIHYSVYIIYLLRYYTHISARNLPNFVNAILIKNKHSQAWADNIDARALFSLHILFFPLPGQGFQQSLKNISGLLNGSNISPYIYNNKK